MSDTPCVDGCGQDAATIERLREQLAKVEALAERLAQIHNRLHGDVEINRQEHRRGERDLARWLHDDLRAALAPQNPPQDASHAPEAPGQPGRGEDAADGRVEALARVLRSVGVEIGYAGADTYRTVVAERILADPGPLLEALAEAGVLTEESRDLHDGPLEKVWLTDRVYFSQLAVTGQERRYVTEWSPDARA